MLDSSEMTCPCCSKPFCPLTNPIVPFGNCEHEICEDCRSKQTDNIHENFQTIKCFCCGKVDELNLKQLRRSHEKQRE